MVQVSSFKRGDQVVHPLRPEWGEGIVENASTIAHQGTPAQRLVIRFANYGLVTINTGIAPLLAKEVVTSMGSTLASSTTSSQSGSSFGGGWLADLESKPRNGELYALPADLTDPFASLAKRLSAILETYRFTADQRVPGGARSILDWAMAQTGLADPLTKYTRHELEQAFPRFARDRDALLQELVRTLKKQGRRDVLEQTRQSITLAAAKQAFERALRN
jgi:hypothetical protein